MKPKNNLLENPNENSQENSRVNSFDDLTDNSTDSSTRSSMKNSSIMININSDSEISERWKKWLNKNFSGRYQMVDTVNDRLAYKVSFIVKKANLT